jgi:hypothetical protein
LKLKKSQEQLRKKNKIGGFCQDEWWICHEVHGGYLGFKHRKHGFNQGITVDMGCG